MASAIALLVRSTRKSEFQRVNPESARVILLDIAPRALGSFSEELSRAAIERLESLGGAILQC